MTTTTLALLFLLGLTLSAAPGALNVETARRGLSHGFAPALTLQLGALLGDAVWVLATLAGLALGLQTSAALPACMLVGGAAMLWTAWRILRPVPRADGPLPSHRGGLALGAVLALSSPLTVAFWAAVTAMVQQDLGRGATGTELALVAAAYVLSVLLWAMTLSSLTAWGGRLFSSAPTRLLNLCCAVVMVAWGVQLIGRAAVSW